jgi:class 3 adenylate cyclase
MQWNFERSKERLAAEAKRIQNAGLNIKRLTREMDLFNLSPTDARIVHGTHLYCDLSNFDEILSSPLLKRDDYRRLHRLLHVLRTEQRYTLQQFFFGDKIQVQGPRFHGIIYKPYDDDEKLAWNSVLAALAIQLITCQAVPRVFLGYPSLSPSIGIELGDCLVANIGARGDRELISVGKAANHAAKLIADGDTITVGAQLWALLSEEHQQFFRESDGGYVFDNGVIQDAEELLENESFSWTIEKSAERMKSSCDNLPLNEIDSSGARTLIDFDLLGPKTMKTCSGASLFVDVDGYTAAIDALMEDEEALAKALQWLHLFRYEVCRVTTDRDAAPVQHQGDRLQSLSHLPYDNGDSARRRALYLCIDYNSSVEEVLNIHHSAPSEFHVAIGASFGDTVAIRSGVRGDMDSSCLGQFVAEAEHLQTESAGTEISISPSIYQAINDEVIQECFSYDEDRSCYIAKGLTWTRIADLRKLKKYESGEPASFDAARSTIVFGAESYKRPGVVPLTQTRNWGLND